MSSAILDNTIYKLIVLFVFDKMEIPITEKTLLDLCSTDNNWLNYMECKETLSGLIDAGFVYHSDDSANGKLYSITPDGRLCLSHFFIRIPSTLRESIAEYIKSNRIKDRKKLLHGNCSQIVGAQCICNVTDWYRWVNPL